MPLWGFRRGGVWRAGALGGSFGLTSANREVTAGGDGGCGSRPRPRRPLRGGSADGLGLSARFGAWKGGKPMIVPGGRDRPSNRRAADIRRLCAGLRPRPPSPLVVTGPEGTPPRQSPESPPRRNPHRESRARG
ncbi:hypothetical protein EV190_11351 [Actinorugispora endophytica]|uniref:Uncharacterized protein n=1 Tax=Actinorugispora endophytica TaxID=1605990 RepID=A0A4R6UT27_9ACTN|nr:hypothetical protein EV190_11351 [Actinorugispora endophytica]